MKFRFCSLLFVVAALSLSGCRMCCPSYDYCGPTEPGESNDEFCGFARRGSIFSSAPVYHEGEYHEGEYLEGETILEEQAEPVVVPPPAPPMAPKAAMRSR